MIARHARVGLACTALALAAACSSLPDLKGFGYAVSYQGNESFPSFRLSRVIEDLLIDFGRAPDNEAPILDAAQDLEDFYLGEGFADVTVGYSIAREPALAVSFAIVEGPRVTVASIELDAIAILTDAELLPLWRRKTSGFLALGDPYFVLGDLQAFAVAVRERYYARGHLDAAVAGPYVRRAPGAEEASVRYRVTEGPQYRVGAVVVADELKGAGAPDVAADLVGAPFSSQRLQAARIQVREKLRNLGYFDPRVVLRLEFDRTAKTVAAQISGEPGKRVRVAGYEIEGLQRTARGVVEGEIEFEVGDWYSGEKVDETMRELYLTGLFERIEIDATEVADDEVRLRLALHEVEAKEFSVMAGYGSYEQLRGGVSYTDRNLFGRGHQLRAGVRASQKGYGTNVTWTEPTVFGSDTSLSVTGFFREREEPTFTDQSFGLSTALSRRLFEDAQGRIGYSLASREGTTVSSIAQLFGSDFVAGSVFTEFTYDKRSSVIFPESGHREFIKVEFANQNLGGEVDFWRLTAGSAWFFPLLDWAVLGLHYEAGLIWWLDNEPVPVQERFYNGGFNTVRSFEQSQLGPKDAAGEPLGGEFRNVINAELRFPIVSLLEGALFADAGNVGLAVEQFTLGDLSYGLGGGLRLDLPIGPVRLDAAWNPSPGPFERDYSLHFSVGFPF